MPAIQHKEFLIHIVTVKLYAPRDLPEQECIDLCDLVYDLDGLVNVFVQQTLDSRDIPRNRLRVHTE